uniref:Uncharacterized protein n=1 Tax=Arundo donax TaxID=35708 RepID=A0A0A9BPJ5_ARUDO
MSSQVRVRLIGEKLHPRPHPSGAGPVGRPHPRVKLPSLLGRSHPPTKRPTPRPPTPASAGAAVVGGRTRPPSA